MLKEFIQKENLKIKLGEETIEMLVLDTIRINSDKTTKISHIIDYIEKCFDFIKH